MARDWCHSHESVNFELRLLSKRTSARQYNAPTVSKVAALITNDFGDGLPSRDIVVDSKDGGLKRISELHPSYMALQYPLLFPYGEDGFHEKIPYHTNRRTRKTKRGYVSMKEYYSYVIQQRNGQGDTNVEGLGKHIVFPTTFTGGPRYMMQNHQDAMALCRAYGNPDLFITFTSNPKWLEISEMLAFIPGQKPYERPKVGTRAHINVEWCNRLKAIKYLFKYLNKGPDRATFVIQENVQKPAHREHEKVAAVDEIKNYLNYRYLAPCEAVWQLFSFDIHYSQPSVMKLNFHFEDHRMLRLWPWAHAIKEAAFWALAPQLRDLFITMFLFWDVSRPLHLWEQTWKLLSEDILCKKRKLFKRNQEYIPIQNYHFKIIIRTPDCPYDGFLRLRDVAVYYHFAISTFPVKIVIRSSAFIVEYLLQLPIRYMAITYTGGHYPMTQKYAFEALDRTLRDILGYKNPEKRNAIFKGVTVLLGGDFRKIIPVIPKGKGAEIVQACINRSEL
ncbi:helicase [Tanacetum coccineum]